MADAGVDQEEARWKRRWWGARTANGSNTQQDQGTLEVQPTGSRSSMAMDDATKGSWYQGIWNRMPNLPSVASKAPRFVIGKNVRYSQLNAAEIEYLEVEARDAIGTHLHSWCWYEDFSVAGREVAEWDQQKPGILSVYETGSEKCPLALQSYPQHSKYPGHHVYVKNSVLVPAESPLQIFHREPLSTKISNCIKEYYNFPNEKHLYLKKEVNGLLKNKRTVIISIVGHLPEKYEKFSLGNQRTARYIASKLVRTLNEEDPKSIEALSFECPLDTKELKTVLKECIELLMNFKNIIENSDCILFTGVYHSVPLVILLATHILQNDKIFGINSQTTYVGLLSFDSPLQGYRFWDHNTDMNNSINSTTTSEQDYNKIQQIREKQLFQGANKSEEQILSQIRNYRKLDSEESRLVQRSLNWMLLNWDNFRVTLTGRLYDNFLTVSQKLALDYSHPKIFRSLWCDGKNIGIDTRKPKDIGIPDINIETLRYELDLELPKGRSFEVVLVSYLLLAINLGYTQFVPMLKLISPFFVSRSFNENTISSNIKKQQQNEIRPWLQEMDSKWKNIDTVSEQSADGFPKQLSTIHSYLEFAHYQNWKNPELMHIFNEIYDDDAIYKSFMENTLKTKNPYHKKKLALLSDHSTPKSILNTINQYDLVWKFHEMLCEFLSLCNLPCQKGGILPLHFAISLDYSFPREDVTRPLFEKNNTEALACVTRLWETYQDWDPPTRGLKQLRNIFSVLALYDDADKLIQELSRN